ncbi:MAG: DUF4827 domain-containing protein [Prevotella sp.]|nr:DUF4827 domain-containing protein [Prevotella sp.]
MKRNVFLYCFVVCAAVVFDSCSDEETYADMRKKEDAAINAYLSDYNVKVISEDTFAAQGYTTDVSKNEYVLFDSNGIYLQIIRQGCGEKIQPGETTDILCRFSEYNLLGDSLQLSNDNLYYSSIPEKMTVTNNSGTFSGSFDTESSLMYAAYSSSSVPSGWLYPLTYLNIGRPVNDDDETAKIAVIVPSAQGQYYASANVYPCLYVITYERGM